MKRNYEGEITAGHVLNRREMLVLMGATAAAMLAGCGRRPSGPYTRTTVADCLVSPQQTEGPYFVDEKLKRSDIRQDPSDNSMRPGVPLRMVLNVYGVANNACNPLPGATVDIWHCDALGAYSDVKDDPGEFGDTRGKKFLRVSRLVQGQGRAHPLQDSHEPYFRSRPRVHVTALL